MILKDFSHLTILFFRRSIAVGSGSSLKHKAKPLCLWWSWIESKGAFPFIAKLQIQTYLALSANKCLLNLVNHFLDSHPPTWSPKKWNCLMWYILHNITWINPCSLWNRHQIGMPADIFSACNLNISVDTTTWLYQNFSVSNSAFLPQSPTQEVCTTCFVRACCELVLTADTTQT